jgi:hypothetical protein
MPGRRASAWSIRWLSPGADDDTVENNLEHLTGNPAYSVYQHAVRLSTPGGPCWLLQYHYYFSANWQSSVSAAGGYTHEHDWEWIYVFAGWSSRLNRYVGYAAVLSSHDENNLEAMQRHHTYLFPLIVLDPEEENQWVRSARRLSRWTSDEDESLTRVAAVVTGKGNAFSPDIEDYSALLDIGVPSSVNDPPGTWQLGYAGTDCMRMTSEESCYGDPNVCAIPFICSGTGECDDCDASRYAVWRRSGLWTEDSVPALFSFPEDLKTEVDPEPGAILALEVEATGAEWALHWCWDSEQCPIAFELVASRPAIGWRCSVGRIPLHETQCYEVVVRGGCEAGGGEGEQSDDEGDGRATMAPDGTWILHSSCVYAPELAGGRLELWAHWPSGERVLVGRSLKTLCAPQAEDLRISVGPNPLRGECTVRFFVPREVTVALDVSDVSGRRIKELDHGARRPGWHTLIWDGCDEAHRAVPVGIYWVRLRVPGIRLTERILVVR